MYMIRNNEKVFIYSKNGQLVDKEGKIICSSKATYNVEQERENMYKALINKNADLIESQERVKKALNTPIQHVKNNEAEKSAERARNLARQQKMNKSSNVVNNPTETIASKSNVIDKPKTAQILSIQKKQLTQVQSRLQRIKKELSDKTKKQYQLTSLDIYTPLTNSIERKYYAIEKNYYNALKYNGIDVNQRIIEGGLKGGVAIYIGALQEKKSKNSFIQNLKINWNKIIKRMSLIKRTHLYGNLYYFGKKPTTEAQLKHLYRLQKLLDKKEYKDDCHNLFTFKTYFKEINENPEKIKRHIA